VSAVFAGWAMGYFMAMLSTPALVFVIFRAGVSGVLDRWVAPDVNRLLLAVPIFLGASLSWTMAGLILGSFYDVADFASKPNALGSPSWPFTLIIAALAVLPLPALLLLFRRFWWLWTGMAAAFLLSFGWIMPLLAAR
jgi:hypothetical protein